MGPPEEQQWRKQPPAPGSVGARPEEVGRGVEEAGGEGYQRRAELARQLLKPRRRAQIEVWTREVADRWDLQHCVFGKRYSHHRGLLKEAPAPGRPSIDSGEFVCPVCGRVPEDVKKKPSIAQPAQATTEQQAIGDSKPGGGDENDSNKKNKKSMFRDIRAALTARGGNKGGGEKKHQQERQDQALSTQMFLAVASEYDASSATATRASGRFSGLRPNKELEERMSRLMRAQKLLEKSQARQ